MSDVALSPAESSEIARLLDRAALAVRRLGTARTVEELGRLAVGISGSLLDADVAWYADHSNDRWIVTHQRGLEIAGASHTVRDSMIDGVEALLSGEPLVYASFDRASPAMRDIARAHGVESSLMMPLMVEGVCEAMLGLGRRSEHVFGDRDLALAGIVSAQIGARMRELRAQARSRATMEALAASELLVREQLRRKERVVDILQRTYIPRVLPTVPGLRFDALYLPADDEARVGGDWYDVVEIEDGRLLFSIGDVSGNGIDAAVTMGFIRQAIFTVALSVSSPSDVLVMVNRALLAQDFNVATAVVGIFDPADRSVRYACAGHPPPIMSDGGVVRVLPYGGIPLGVQPVTEFEIHTVTLSEDALLLFYTDALIEHDRDVVAGVDRLLTVLREMSVRSDESENLSAYIADQVFERASISDDLAILTMRSFPREQSRGISSIQTHRDSIAWDFHTVDPRSIAIVRDRFNRFLGPLVTSTATLLESEIVLGELLANAVEHAPGRVHVELEWDHETPVLSVRDYGTGGVGHPVLPADTLNERGRGMFLVEQFAKKIQVERCADGGTNVIAWLGLVRLGGRAHA